LRSFARVSVVESHALVIAVGRLVRFKLKHRNTIGLGIAKSGRQAGDQGLNPLILGSVYLSAIYGKSPLAAGSEQSYDSAAMADSLFTRARKKTGFLSIQKTVAAIGLSALTLLWNWIFGMRNWDTTKTFLLCLPLAYGSVALVALVWNLTVLGAKDWWAGFIVGLKTDLIGAVKEATKEAVPVEPKTPRLRSTGGRTDAHTVIKIMEFLHDKPKQTLSIVAETGDPDAYSDVRRLREAFDGSGWVVSTGTSSVFGGPGLFLFTNSQTPTSTLAEVSEALASSGLSFRHRKMDSEEFTTCTIYVSNRIS
jgi:hypothetical protein